MKVANKQTQKHFDWL